MAANDALPASQDPRWATFNTTGYNCSCGERHVGLFPIHMHVPVGWPGGPNYQLEGGQYRPDDELRMDGDFLSSSFCVWGGKHFAMRMRLFLQVKGAEPAAFLYTAWAGLDRMDFEAFVDTLQNPGAATGLRSRARLLNRLANFPDTYNLSGTAVYSDQGLLPMLMIHGLQAAGRSDHSLITQQRDHISLDRVFELYSGYGHNMVPAQ